MALEGHVKPVLGISFSPFGYHAATGSEDNICWISYQPTQILYPKFEPQEGCYLVTSSYDMTAKVWSGRYFKPVKTLSAHEAKVTSLNINAVVGVDAEILRGLERGAINRIFLTLPERKKNVKLLFLSTVQIPNGHHIATVSHDRTIKLYTSRSNDKHAMEVE
ncbi:hypothetical protein BDE02_16G041500 [Populus trichocarpa]|nr:hypothetical protein BDE02_16G041500 [Populus trichocarpa]